MVQLKCILGWWHLHSTRTTQLSVRRHFRHVQSRRGHGTISDREIVEWRGSYSGGGRYFGKWSQSHTWLRPRFGGIPKISATSSLLQGIMHSRISRCCTAKGSRSWVFLKGSHLGRACKSIIFTESSNVAKIKSTWTLFLAFVCIAHLCHQIFTIFRAPIFRSSNILNNLCPHLGS